VKYPKIPSESTIFGKIVETICAQIFFAKSFVQPPLCPQPNVARGGGMSVCYMKYLPLGFYSTLKQGEGGGFFRIAIN